MDRPLKVWVNDQPAGLLMRGKPGTSDTVFNYFPGTRPAHSLSLTMLTRPQSFEFEHGTPPVFQMSLPEGKQRERIEGILAKTLNRGLLTDFDLLSIVGHNLVGRIRVTGVDDERPRTQPCSENLEDILRSDHRALFDELLKQYVQNTGVSGVHPKFLADFRAPMHYNSQAAVGTEHYIVKSFGDDTPEMAWNEHQCQQAAAKAGIDVCQSYLSDTRRCLVVERFDFMDDGQYLGFEDFCVLRQQSPIAKYQGGYEDFAHTISSVLGPKHSQPGREEFFRRLVFSNIIRNGDFHAKNIGVMYKDPSDRANVKLAPAYDLVTTTLYRAHDKPALATRQSSDWLSRDELETFGIHNILISRHQARRLINEVAHGVAEQLESMKAEHVTTDVATGVVAALCDHWKEGLAHAAQHKLTVKTADRRVSDKAVQGAPANVSAGMGPGMGPG